ncbi:unnamed protein product [Blepharisma stoltei]|uniref:Uncharacterized protein n=1 Tax=Blepharisma stoltei TaxID=1481888 RepID=A0AAU9IZW5_9CILI|nr:unnamed protein product [Blepharisma stoltei]
MEEEEKLLIPYQEKDEGNRLYKLGEIENASKSYSKALLAVNYLFKDAKIVEEDAMKYVKEIKIPCLLNLSACYLKLKSSYENVIIHCSDVLSIEPENSKALYRRGVANMELANYDEARKDLKEARNLEPNDNNIYEAQVELKKKISAYKEKTKKIAQKTFESKKEPIKESSQEATKEQEATIEQSLQDPQPIPDLQPATQPYFYFLFKCCRRRANIQH